MFKMTLVAAITSLWLCSAAAQTVSAPDAASPAIAPKVLDLESEEFKKLTDAMKREAPTAITLETIGSALTPEERKRGEELAKQITDKTLSRYHSDESKQYEQMALDMKRRADDIADEALSGRRDKVLKFLGINPKGNSNLYYFVSFAMPLPMLRSYVLEAMWSGGTVVLRGVPKGRSVKDFFTEDLRSLIYGKGAAANISLDPRLFEVYDIQAVPAIVYTEDRRQLTCNTDKSSPVMVDGAVNTYGKCSQLDPSKFWKISGAVTSGYALQSFVDTGAAGAKVYLLALRKGMAPGAFIDKNQLAFKGDWKDAISPDELLAQRQAIEEARKKLNEAQGK